jgi:hypothetical protein
MRKRQSCGGAVHTSEQALCLSRTFVLRTTAVAPFINKIPGQRVGTLVLGVSATAAVVALDNKKKKVHRSLQPKVNQKCAA